MVRRKLSIIVSKDDLVDFAVHVFTMASAKSCQDDPRPDDSIDKRLSALEPTEVRQVRRARQDSNLRPAA
jgi:hypothetical protein